MDNSPHIESPTKPAFIIGCLFLTGIGLGIGLTSLLAPESETAFLIGFLVLPICFVLGLSFWYAVVTADGFSKIGKALLISLRTGDLQGAVMKTFSAPRGRTLDGTRIFVPITVLISFLAGCLVAQCTITTDYGLVVAGYTCVGLFYSMAVTWIARMGFLPKTSQS